MKWLFASVSLCLLLTCKTLGENQNKSIVTTSTGPGGNVVVDVKTFSYANGTKVFNTLNINGGAGLSISSEDNDHLFGVNFSPYTSSNSQENNALSPNPSSVEAMLRIINTKFHAVMTNSMGVPDSNYNGPWDKARMDSLISMLAAQINQKNNSLNLKVLQGSRLFKNSKKQPDVENAFKAAESANKVYPGTVWGISLNVDNEWGFIQNKDEVRQVINALNQQGYKLRAIDRGLQIGTKMDICSEIVDGNDQSLLIELASICNFIVCYVNPPFGTEKPEDGVARIGITYQRYSEAFAKVNPNIDVAIATGWATEDDSDFNYKEQNTPKIQGRFWSAMKKWAIDNHLRVYMHDAFDQPAAKGNHYKHLGLWQRSKDGSNKYIEKLTNKVVNV